MNYFKTGLLFTVLTAVLSISVSVSAKNPGVEAGKKAPDFTLQNLDGKAVTLSDYTKPDQPEKGNIVLLQWINPDCPFCNRVHNDGLVKKMMDRIREMKPDIVHLQINSTHYMGADRTSKYVKKHDVQPTTLMDQDGQVGKKYDAKTTPHMFLIDRKGVLRYRGAMDNDKFGRKSSDKRTNYVIQAVRQLTDGKEISPNKTRPYGCSVKYEE